MLTRSLFCVCLAAGTAAAQSRGFDSGRCTGISPATATVTLSSSTRSRQIQQVGDGIAPGERIATGAANCVSFYLFAGKTDDLAAASAEMILYVAANSQVAFQQRPTDRSRDSRRHIHVAKGACLIVYRPADKSPLVVSTASFWVHLDTGFLWVAEDGGKMTVSLLSGTGRRFDGILPDAGPAAAGSSELPAASAWPSGADQLLAELTSTRTAKDAMDWVYKAIQGDVVPTAVAGRALPAGAVPGAGSLVGPVNQAQTGMSVTGAAITPFVSTSGRVATGVESLLTSGDPGSVVAGRRILGARWSSWSGSGLRFNREARAPLGLVPR